MRHKTLLSYIIVFDSTYKVLEFKVEETTEDLSGTVICSNIPFIHSFWKQHGSCVFILAKTNKALQKSHLWINSILPSCFYWHSLHKAFQTNVSIVNLIFSAHHATLLQAHQSCYLNGWQIEYHSDHATLGVLIYRVQGKNAEYKLFRNLLYQRVFSEHPPLAEQTDYFSLLIVLISYLLHWKQRLIHETICIKQQINPVY